MVHCANCTFSFSLILPAPPATPLPAPPPLPAPAPNQELVAATPSQRNWKGIAIALLVIGGVIGLVALAVVIITPEDPGPRVRGARLTLADVVDPERFAPRNLNGSWISG